MLAGSTGFEPAASGVTGREGNDSTWQPTLDNRGRLSPLLGRPMRIVDARSERLRVLANSSVGHPNFNLVPAARLGFARRSASSSTVSLRIPAAVTDRTISHYRLLGVLGEGGMGVVYKAEDSRLRRFVALKLLSERISDDRVARDRFYREAQAASALNHPGICTIYESARRTAARSSRWSTSRAPPLDQVIAGGACPGKRDRLALEMSMRWTRRTRRVSSTATSNRRTSSSPRAAAKVLDFGIAKPAVLGRSPSAQRRRSCS